MEDPQVVAAIVAGDPTGLAEAYDRYATPLYAYCRSILREPADAADAVQDTYLIATAKLRDLRDPAKLRPWLYAVARNECLRRLRVGAVTSGLEEAAEVPAESADVTSGTERADLRALVRDAIDGLNPKERDVIELSLVHEVEGEDLRDALGVSRNHAHALLSRARSQLERSLGALIVARTGRDACAELDAMLSGWDGQLTVLIRKRISRHIEQCEVCGERKRRELTPALFAGALPAVALVPGFREELLRVLADRSPAGLAHRLSVANRAGPFGPAGFPKPVSAPGVTWPQLLRHSHALVASSATSVVAAGTIAVVVIGGPHHGSPEAAGGSAHGAPVSHGGPATRGAPSGSTGNTANGGHALAPTASASGPVTVPAVAATTGVPVTSPGPAVSSSPGTTAAASPAGQGALSVSPTTLDLVALDGTATGTITLTAEGGPVSDYSVTAGPAVAGEISVSPSSGSLAAGASVTITVTSTSLVALDTPITVNPGGQTVTVLLGVGL